MANVLVQQSTRSFPCMNACCASLLSSVPMPAWWAATPNPGRDVLKNPAVTSQLARVGQNTRTDPLSSIVSRTSTAM